MSVLGVVCSVLSVVLLIATLLVSMHNWAYKAAWKEGYAAGRKDADNWWIGAEAGAEQARQTIWREER